jgi:hypothetical protein
VIVIVRDAVEKVDIEHPVLLIGFENNYDAPVCPSWHLHHVCLKPRMQVPEHFLHFLNDLYVNEALKLDDHVRYANWLLLRRAAHRRLWLKCSLASEVRVVPLLDTFQ